MRTDLEGFGGMALGLGVEATSVTTVTARRVRLVVADRTLAAREQCHPGFHAAGSTCVEDSVCKPETCNSHGFCNDLAGFPRCDCFPGASNPPQPRGRLICTRPCTPLQAL
jgi:hypothetical protein